MRGSNNSSITIVTDLIDIDVDASSFVGDLGGNFSFEGEDILVAGLDIVGVVDPTGVADVAAASLEFKNGNILSGIASAAGVVPFVGDVGKLGKISKHVKTINKAIDGVKQASKRIGPIPDTSIRKQALDIKRNLNNGKNSVNVGTKRGTTHFDLDGATHKGVDTPHVQQSIKNTNPKTGRTFTNKDRKNVRPMNQQDIRTVRKVLEKRQRN